MNGSPTIPGKVDSQTTATSKAMAKVQISEDVLTVMVERKETLE